MLNLKQKKILVTGANGGIGQQLVKQLAGQGAQLVLTGRNEDELQRMAAAMQHDYQIKAVAIACDISNHSQCQQLIKQAVSVFGELDILINLAGLQTFKPLAAMTDQEISSQIDVNLKAPIVLAQQAARVMKQQNQGLIVNIGSTFGSIGFANFSVYSSAKFGLRGFSEALRRELADTNVKVTYIAPRATRTAMNDQSLYQMAQATKMNFDSPQKVAKEIIRAITSQKHTHFIGFPEKFFAKLNAIVPALVDKALVKQNQIAQKYL